MLKISPMLFAERYTESFADQTDHFLNVFVRKNFVYRYDVWKFTADAILFREIHRKERDVLVAFSGQIWLEWEKICKNNDNTCLFHCINNCRVPREMFEHSACPPRVQTLPQDPANLISVHTAIQLLHVPLQLYCTSAYCQQTCSNFRNRISYAEHGIRDSIIAGLFCMLIASLFSAFVCFVALHPSKQLWSCQDGQFT